jgi:hypothetical protein
MIRLPFATCVCLVGLLACSRTQESLGPIPPGAPLLTPDQTLSIDATVRFSPIEGGCWLLVEEAGSRYVFRLPERFRGDGLKVHAVIRGSSSGSFCGPGVTLDSIRIR